jgi:hypothetical protein
MSALEQYGDRDAMIANSASPAGQLHVQDAQHGAAHSTSCRGMHLQWLKCD